ncbi:hypothetical protein OUZ56_024374 [Daphnia magna]|uniref:Uncharacterized protein n=1 Tax=Daphnia magna TaxID=35525 RepID=A0ABR0B1C0_9CRUS|nr:hypothetical protein OUZ56_024374 [Daphnia magna]
MDAELFCFLRFWDPGVLGLDFVEAFSYAVLERYDVIHCASALSESWLVPDPQPAIRLELHRIPPFLGSHAFLAFLASATALLHCAFHQIWGRSLLIFLLGLDMVGNCSSAFVRLSAIHSPLPMMTIQNSR